MRASKYKKEKIEQILEALVVGRHSWEVNLQEKKFLFLREVKSRLKVSEIIDIEGNLRHSEIHI